MSLIKKMFFFIFIFFQVTTASSKIAIGEWRTHFSYDSADKVVFADNKVYVVANGKLYSYLTNKGTLETYSVLTGLSGHNISFISWCKIEKTLVIIYSDGNIDFLNDSGIFNLPDLKNKVIEADKTVYGIRMEGSKAYLSTGIGLLLIDMKKREIEETYYLNFSSGSTPVYDAAVWGDSIIVVTKSGLYSGNTTSNLVDASLWSPVTFVSGANATEIVRFNNELFVLAGNGNIYKNDTSNWTIFLSDPNISSISVQDSSFLFICAGTNLYMYNSKMQLQNIDPVQNYSISMNADSDLLYVASGERGLSILSNINAKYAILKDSILPNGPAQSTAWNAFFKDGVYYATVGGRWGDRYFYKGDILVYKDEKWSNLQNKEYITNKTGLPLEDFINLAIDPSDNKHYFITSWGEGLYEFRDSVFYKLYSYTNSPLKTAIPGSPNFIRVDGATFDKDGNLWVLNSKADSVLHILKKDGTWYTPFYSNLPNAATWNSILFNKNNQVWMNSVREGKPGIYVLDYNNTLEQTDDDKTRWFFSFTDQDGITLSPQYVLCVTEDLNGEIWIGTIDGPFIVTDPSDVFNSDFSFTRVKIPRNDGTDNADYLLNNVWINCITVDGGNRKWIGTNGYGVYLISADGLNTIHHFTADNSPLPSDYIWSIAIHPETGEVFLGTDQGLVSYRSDATQGAEAYSNVHVFPNPVKPTYTGLITVTGLMESTQIKITDLSGNVIIAGTSLGGQFTWNGYTKRGKRAASGVYLVFCVSEDGTEYQTCKFMIIN